MSSLPNTSLPKRGPLLKTGERLTQPEFHRRYELQPPHVKAELIEGVVYVASPTRRPHGLHHPKLSGVFWFYEGFTPGIELLDNATTILGPHSEPQPDLALRILPEYGGSSGENPQQYVTGAPELVAEIAHSSRDIDLNQKLRDYRAAGVLEYIVWSLEEPELFWFDFKKDQELKPNRQGVYRSRVFPGLWVERQALLNRDTPRLLAVVQQGIAHASHATFVKRLEAAHRRLSQ